MYSAVLLDWISAEPAACLRVVLAVLVFAEAGDLAPGLGTETVGEGGGERANRDEGFAEGRVLVVDGDNAVRTGAASRGGQAGNTSCTAGCTTNPHNAESL